MTHIDDVSKRYISEARRWRGGTCRKTAGILGISYRSLRHLIDKYGLREAERVERIDARPEV